MADELGPSLRWATAQVTKNERRGPAEAVRRRQLRSGGGRTGAPGAAPAPDTDTTRSLSDGTEQRPVDRYPPQRRRTSAGGSRRRSASSARTASTASTTRTSTCCASSCPTGARSAPAGSRATARSTSGVAQAIKTAVSWCCCPTPSARSPSVPAGVAAVAVDAGGPRRRRLGTEVPRSADAGDAAPR